MSRGIKNRKINRRFLGTGHLLDRGKPARLEEIPENTFVPPIIGSIIFVSTSIFWIIWFWAKDKIIEKRRKVK